MPVGGPREGGRKKEEGRRKKKRRGKEEEGGSIAQPRTRETALGKAMVERNDAKSGRRGSGKPEKEEERPFAL